MLLVFDVKGVGGGAEGTKLNISVLAKDSLSFLAASLTFLSLREAIRIT